MAIKQGRRCLRTRSFISTTSSHIYKRRANRKSMASKTKNATDDVEFEPYCEWQKDEKSDNLILHLPDFKKDQLRVQVNNLGFLKVSGERPIDGYKSRFVKETKIPQGCSMNDIRAKFINGRLHISMPKKAPQVQDQQAASTPSAPPEPAKSEAVQKPEPEALVSNGQKSNSPTAENGQMGTVSGYDEAKEDKFGLGSLRARMQVGKKVSVSFGVAVAAVVAIGIYAAYKCGTEPYPSPIGDYIKN